MNKIKDNSNIENENIIIFLDFDGVLFNTVKEAYAVATISMQRYNSIDEINYDLKHYQNFLKYRYLVGPAWNYKYILQLLENNNVVNFEHKYKLLITRAQKKHYEEFEDIFFKTRINLQKLNFEKWLKLNEAYSFLEQIKQDIINNKNKFIIVTTKDKVTVLKLLELENIIIEENYIYDKDDFSKYENKANIINKIIETNKIKKSIFIDDSKKHLENCNKIENLKLYQASWGYISPLDKDTVNMDVISNALKKFIG